MHQHLLCSLLFLKAFPNQQRVKDYGEAMRGMKVSKSGHSNQEKASLSPTEKKPRKRVDTLEFHLYRILLSPILFVVKIFGRQDLDNRI